MWRGGYSMGWKRACGGVRDVTGCLTFSCGSTRVTSPSLTRSRPWLVPVCPLVDFSLARTGGGRVITSSCKIHYTASYLEFYDKFVVKKKINAHYCKKTFLNQSTSIMENLTSVSLPEVKCVSKSQIFHFKSFRLDQWTLGSHCYV